MKNEKEVNGMARQPTVCRTWDVTEVRYMYKGCVVTKILYGSLTPFQVKRTMNNDELILSMVHKKIKCSQSFTNFVKNSKIEVLEIYGEK